VFQSPRDPARFDPDGRTLRVGGAEVPIAPGAGNEAILEVYVGLVRRQRGLTAANAFEVRADDIAALAPVLDLADVQLRDQIERVIGLSSQAARSMHAALVRRRAAITAAVGVASVAALTGVGVIHLPQGSDSTPQTTASAVASTDSGVTPSIGDAVVITPPPTTEPSP